MDERAKKTLVIVVGVVLFGAVIAWRSYMALEPEGGDTNWDAMLVKHLVAHGPKGLPDLGSIVLQAPPPHAIRLGLLQMPQRLEVAQAVQHSHKIYMPVIRALHAAGGNAVLHGRIDQDDPNLRLGWAYLDDTAYFVYAGPLSATWHQRLGQVACKVTECNGIYVKGGLQPGDLLVDVDHGSRTRGWRHRPRGCHITDPLGDLPRTHTAIFTVLRQGKLLDLTMHRDGISEYWVADVPILSDAQIAALDHSGDVAAPAAGTPPAN